MRVKNLDFDEELDRDVEDFKSRQPGSEADEGVSWWRSESRRDETDTAMKTEIDG